MRKLEQMLGYVSVKTSDRISHGSHADTDLLYFLVSGGRDDVALIAREAFGEPLQDLCMGLRGRLMMTCKKKKKLFNHVLYHQEQQNLIQTLLAVVTVHCRNIVLHCFIYVQDFTSSSSRGQT